MSNIFGNLNLRAQRGRPAVPPVQKKEIPVPMPEGQDYRCAWTIYDFDTYMAPVFKEHRDCAFDIETAPLDQFRNEPKAALDPHKSNIVGISFSHTPGTGIYVPLRHRVGRNFELPVSDFMHALHRAFFHSGRILKIAHNIAFESMFFYKEGIVIQLPAYDTIAAGRLTLKNPKEYRELHDCGLKTLSKEILRKPRPSFTDVTAGRHFDELDPADPATIEYAVMDSDDALRLRYYFKAWFAEYIPRHDSYCQNVDTPACIYTGLMKYNGIPVDKDLMDQKRQTAEATLADLRRQLMEIIGPGVEIGKNASTMAFERWLFDTKGYPVLKYTEKGARSMDDETFQLLMAWCEDNDRQDEIRLFELLQEYRKWGKLLSTYIEGYSECINSVTGRIHADLIPIITDTSRFASRAPNLQNCFDDQTEILTPRGWVLFRDLMDEDRVAQWDGETKRITFVSPMERIDREHHGELVYLKNEHIDLAVTPDHRCLLLPRRTAGHRVFPAHSYPEDHMQLHAAQWDGGAMSLSDAWVRALCAVQADGSYHDNGIMFCFSKERKMERCIEIAMALGIPYSTGSKTPRDGKQQMRIRWKACPEVSRIMHILGPEKKWGPWVMELDRRTVDLLLGEILFWDGCWTRKNHYSSSKKSDADWMQALYTLSGTRAKLRAYHNGNPRSALNYQLDITRRDYSMTTNVERVSRQYQGRVYCVSVPSGFIVVRRNGATAITGNCPRKDNDPIGVRKFFKAPPGYTFVDFDFSQIELRVGAVYCRDEKLLEIYRTGGDVHAMTTSVIYGIPYEQAKDKSAPHFKERRTIAKNFNFGVYFGLFPAGAQRNLRFKAGVIKTIEECQEWIDNLMRGYPRIREWQEAAKKRATEFQYVETAFGFRRMMKGITSRDWGTKSFWERTAMNTAIQGTAAGILKLALGRLIKELPHNMWLRPVLQVHDELLCLCPIEKLQEASAIMKRCMEAQPYPQFDVPVVAEGAYGTCFGELEEME